MWKNVFMKGLVIGMIFLLLFVGTNNIIGESIPPVIHEEIINVFWDKWDHDHDDDDGASSNAYKEGGHAQAFADGDDHTIWAWINHSIDWVCPCNVPSSCNPTITIIYDYIVQLDMDEPTGGNGAVLNFTAFVNDDERSHKEIDEENSEHDIWPPEYRDYTKTFEMNNLVKDKTYNIGVNASTRTYSYGLLGHSKLRIDHSADVSSSRIEIKWDNRAPNNPELDGPIHGEVKTSYKYTAVTTDPDKDRIRYKFDWDDGHITDWCEPVNSGEKYTRSHYWSDVGVYVIGVIAKDENYNMESGWTYLTVNIPRNKPSGCLIGSQVSMYSETSGYTKNIENIVIGDIVQSFDAITQQMAPAEVVEIFAYPYTVCDTYLILDNALTVSSNHAIYIDGAFGLGWFEAHDAEIGDLSLKKEPTNLSWYWEEISSISESPTLPGMMFYDLELLPLASEASGYWANGVLVDSA